MFLFQTFWWYNNMFSIGWQWVQIKLSIRVYTTRPQEILFIMYYCTNLILQRVLDYIRTLFKYNRQLTITSVFTMLGTKTNDLQSYLPKKVLFSTEVKGLVICPLLNEICEDKLNVLFCLIVPLGVFIFQNIPFFSTKSLISCTCSLTGNKMFIS